MVYDDIIIAKLRPGQCIEISMRAIKGIGRDHAKFSAVGTASYKLLPQIEFDWNEDIKSKKRKVKRKDLKYLRDLCPKNVFDIEDHEIVAKRVRDCTLCRACILDENVNKMFGKSTNVEGRYEQFVKLRKKRDHFIFSIENIGQYKKVTDVFFEAIKVLKHKCQQLIDGVEEMKKREDEQIDMDEDEDDDMMHDGDDRMQDID